MGVLDGEVTAAAAIVHVRGDLTLQYETDTRDSLRLCPEGVTRCSNETNEDCAMCAGNVRAKIEVELRLLFTSFQMTLGESNAIATCRKVDGSTGQCASGLRASSLASTGTSETESAFEAFSAGTVPANS